MFTETRAETLKMLLASGMIKSENEQDVIEMLEKLEKEEPPKMKDGKKLRSLSDIAFIHPVGFITEAKAEVIDGEVVTVTRRYTVDEDDRSEIHMRCSYSDGRRSTYECLDIGDFTLSAAKRLVKCWHVMQDHKYAGL